MNDLHDLAAPYALNALEPDERERFESHLEECESCRADVGHLLEGAALIGIEAETPAPPSMKAAVMRRIGGADPAPAVRRGFLPAGFRRWLVAGAAAAVLALAVAAGAVLLSPGENAFDTVAAAGDGVVLELPATDAYDGVVPAARVAFSPSRGEAAIEFAGLAPVGADATYEAWIIADGAATPAALFRPENGGAVVRLDGTPREGALIGITIEPAGGSPQPTGEVLFLVEL